mmetsp:Transcript_4982/g.11001  ORF Transcript_4982/g.11001 Transcript_4982/m.11001 type:complete len:203 (+) Transcript_4982:534-1142(+)
MAYCMDGDRSQCSRGYAPGRTPGEPDFPAFSCFLGASNATGADPVATAQVATHKCNLEEYASELAQMHATVVSTLTDLDRAADLARDQIFGGEAPSETFLRLDEVTLNLEVVLAGLSCRWMEASWTQVQDALCGGMVSGVIHFGCFWVLTAVFALLAALVQYRSWRQLLSVRASADGVFVKTHKGFLSSVVPALAARSAGAP